MKQKILEITNTPEFTKYFLSQFEDCFKVQKRFDNCLESSEIRCKMTYSDNKVDIEFLTEEDRDRFITLQENGQQVTLIQI